MQTNRSNAGALIAGTILIGCGLLSLASRFIRFMDWSFVSSIIVIGFGSIFFMAMLASGRQSAALAVPGSIIGGIGLVLLFESITRQWQTMSYFWTLIVVFVGIGIYIMGWYGGDANQRRSGLTVMKVGFVIFILLGAFFELFIPSFDSPIFPVLLVILGIYLLLPRSGSIGKRKAEESSDQSIPPAS